MITAATLMKSSAIKKLTKDAVKLGYNHLLKVDDIYVFLAKWGVVKPSDNHHKLYLHAVVLFAALGKPVEYISLLMLKSVSEAFKAEKVHGNHGSFALQLDAELHTNSLVLEIKAWDKLPEGDVDHLFSIYDRLMRDTAPASSIAILNGQVDIKQDLGSLAGGQDSIQRMLASIKDLVTDNGNDALLKEYETQINDLTQELAAGHASLILDKFLKFKSRVWDKLNEGLKFRVLTNIGVCHYQLNDTFNAAAVLIEAYQLLPESEIAISNLVNAYMASNDEENARKYLEVFLNTFPESANAQACRIKMNIGNLPVTELEKDLPEKLRQNPEIVASLGIAAHKRDEFDLAISQFHRALLLIPDDIFTLKHLLQSYLEKYAQNFRILNLKILDEKISAEVDEVLALIHLLQEREKTSESKKDLVNLYLSEGFVLSLKKMFQQAHVALDRGLFIDPDNNNLLKQKGYAYAFSGESAMAIKILEKIKDFSLMPDVPTLLAEAYRNVGKPEVGIKILEDFIATKEPTGRLGDYYRRNAAHILLDMCILSSRRSKVITLRKTEFKNGSLLDHLSLARIAYFLEDKDTGGRELLFAYGLITNKSTFQERFFLAIDLQEKGFMQYSINLLFSIVDPKTYSDPAKMLYTLLWTSGQSKQSLEILKQLRDSNGILEKPARFEMECYQQLGDYPKACEIAEQYLEKYPENDEVRLALGGFYNRLGLKEKHLVLMETSIAYLELSPAFFEVYLAQLSGLNKRKQAVAAVYEYQRIKENLEATTIYQKVILRYPLVEESWDYHHKVALDSVVHLKKGNDAFIYILEARASLDLRKNEINDAQENFQRLIGKGVGDEVILDSGEVWTITFIVSKYKYAFERTTRDLKTVYAGKGPLRYFSFEEEIAKLNAQPELLQAKRKAQQQEFNATFGKYNNREISLWSLAKLYQRNLISMRDQVIATPNVGFQCNQGEQLTVEEIHARLSNRRLCADLSTLLAIFEMDLFETVHARFGKLLITPSTIDVILEAMEDNALFKKHPSPDTLLSRFRNAVSDYCEEVFPQSLLELNAPAKNHADRLTGKDVMDTYALALETGGCYLSDDFVNRKAFEEIYQGSALWSGQLARYLTGLGDIADEQLCLCNISLVWRKYQFMGMDAKTLLTAFRHFRKDHPEKLMACLQILSGGRTTEDSALLVCFYYMLIGQKDDYLSEVDKALLCDQVLVVFITNRNIKSSIEKLLNLLDHEFESKIGAEDKVHVPAIKSRLDVLIEKLKNDKLL